MASRCVGASFNSEQLLMLQNVLDEVCVELKLNDDLSRAVKELDWRQERIALEIIQTAAQGEWEPDQIKLIALKRLVAEAVTRQLRALTK